MIDSIPTNTPEQQKRVEGLKRLVPEKIAPFVTALTLAFVALVRRGLPWIVLPRIGVLPRWGAIVAILDERGDNLDSASLAALLRAWRAEDRPAACFIIGGADGLAASLRTRAKLTVAFGPATWPHQLVRIMLLEQLYRAGTILAGHPYHRA